MGDFRTHTRSFAGGEVSPEFFGRIDDVKFQTGLALCRNFIVKPQGPIENRAGTRFVNEVKDSATRTRTIPFVYSFDQTLLIEISVGAFRFHTQGQTVLDGPDPYEVAHTYAEGELFEIKYAQSGDIVTLTHRNHPIRELRRLDATDWELTELAIGPTLDAPTGLSGTPTPGGTPGTPFDTSYVVTALTTTEDESLASTPAVVSNNLFDDGAYNTIEWDAVSGAIRYNIYKLSAGLYGYIGQTDQLEYRDDNIAADLGTTPPLDISASLFAATGDYPGAVSYYEQRRGFAGTDNQPQNIWLTRAGTESNFNYSIPSKDNDSIQFKIASREANSIRHLLPMSDLLALTPSAVWKINGGLSEILTPLTLTAKQNAYVGCSDTKPALVGNNALYAASRGGHLFELGYDGNRNGYISNDVSVRAPHLFDSYTVTSMSVMVAPYPVVWSISTSGLLVGFTYIPEQQIGAFHWHDTLGTFEDVTVINELGRDVTYVVVRRTIDGESRRYIEYFDDRQFIDPADQHFVDCGALYDGEPTNTVEDLDWLEGETVSILADGAVCPQQMVVSGTVSLPEGVEASVIHVGLPYVSDARTLPMALEIAGYGQGMPKNVNTIWLRTYRSSGIFAGPSFEELVEFKQRTIEPMGSPPDLKSEEIEIVLKGAWGDDGAVCIRQTDPIALTVLSFTADVTLGGG